MKGNYKPISIPETRGLVGSIKGSHEGKLYANSSPRDLGLGREQ